MKVFLLLIMIFLHIVDDYYLQGVLAQMKKKSWWEQNNPDPLYKNDYIVALILHGFSWTFMVMLPVMAVMRYTGNFEYIGYYLIMFCINWFIHSYIDHLKANVENCSLVADQTIHIAQILVTWSTMFYGLNII